MKRDRCAGWILLALLLGAPLFHAIEASPPLVLLLDRAACPGTRGKRGAYRCAGHRSLPGMVLILEPGMHLPEEGSGIRMEGDHLVAADGAGSSAMGRPPARMRWKCRG